MASRPKRPKNIETHLYRTPLVGNEGFEMSLGIMNLSNDEADMIARYCSLLNRERAVRGDREAAKAEFARDDAAQRNALLPRLYPTVVISKLYDLPPGEAENLLTATEAGERAFLSSQMKDEVAENTTAKPEPAPGNRFSGLELPDEEA